MTLNCYTQLKLKWANKNQATQSEYIIVPLKQHIPSETNYMLSSLLNYAHFQDKQSSLSFREADWYGTVHETFSTLFHARQPFMLELGCCGWLFNLPIWDWLHHLFCLSSLLLFLWRGRQRWCLGGICRYWIVRADYFNQAHTVCSSAKQMLFKPHLYRCQSTHSCGSHNLFPTVTLVATLLFANYVSQHALVMPRPCTSSSEGHSSWGRESLIRPRVHLLKARGGGWAEEMR